MSAIVGPATQTGQRFVSILGVTVAILTPQTLFDLPTIQSYRPAHHFNVDLTLKQCRALNVIEHLIYDRFLLPFLVRFYMRVWEIKIHVSSLWAIVKYTAVKET